MTHFWVIKKQNGELLKSDNEILFFREHDEAINYISLTCNGLTQFTIEQWSKG